MKTATLQYKVLMAAWPGARVLHDFSEQDESDWAEGLDHFWQLMSPEEKASVESELSAEREDLVQRLYLQNNTLWMSLRDKLAQAALPFALERGPSLPGAGGGITSTERIRLAAAYAYTIADAMMHEREQKR